MILRQAKQLEFPIKKPTAWNAMGFGQNVSTGDLILFPSWVTHSVDVNETEVNRISLSFNTFPVGEIGNNVSNNIRLLPTERGEL